jgi:hypothetical protein
MRSPNFSVADNVYSFFHILGSSLKFPLKLTIKGTCCHSRTQILRKLLKKTHRAGSMAHSAEFKFIKDLLVPRAHDGSAGQESFLESMLGGLSIPGKHFFH